MKTLRFILPYILIALAVVVIVVALNNEAAKMPYPLQEYYGR